MTGGANDGNAEGGRNPHQPRPGGSRNGGIRTGVDGFSHPAGTDPRTRRDGAAGLCVVAVLVWRLSRGGTGGGGETVVFSPVFNFYGGTPSREEAEEAGRISFAEFKKLYRQMKAEEKRKQFSPA